jgi:hypothetical protein
VVRYLVVPSEAAPRPESGVAVGRVEVILSRQAPALEERKRRREASSSSRPRALSRDDEDPSLRSG